MDVKYIFACFVTVSGECNDYGCKFLEFTTPRFIAGELAGEIFLRRLNSVKKILSDGALELIYTQFGL